VVVEAEATAITGGLPMRLHLAFAVAFASLGLVWGVTPASAVNAGSTAIPLSEDAAPSDLIDVHGWHCSQRWAPEWGWHRHRGACRGYGYGYGYGWWGPGYGHHRGGKYYRHHDGKNYKHHGGGGKHHGGGGGKHKGGGGKPHGGGGGKHGKH